MEQVLYDSVEKFRDASSVPVVDASAFLSHQWRDAEALQEAKRLEEAAAEEGIFALHDPRMHDDDPDSAPARFKENMLWFFRQLNEKKRLLEVANHQVGWTPELEVARDYPGLTDRIPEHLRPPEPKGHADYKERFFFQRAFDPLPEYMLVGAEQSTLDLMPENTVPDGAPGDWEWVWKQCFDSLFESGVVAAQMLAVARGLPMNFWVDLMKHGRHLLAPTGANLVKYGKSGHPLAFRHRDLNGPFTVHLKSNFPGLFFMKRSGKIAPAIIPDGCRVFQTAYQGEVVSGGTYEAGLHFVNAVQEMESGIQRCVASDLVPWRTTITLFFHLGIHRLLAPRPEFFTTKAAWIEAIGWYELQTVGQYVAQEIDRLKLVTA